MPYSELKMETIEARLIEFGIHEKDIDRVRDIITASNSKEGEKVNALYCGGAGYDQIIAIFFHKILSRPKIIERAEKELTKENIPNELIERYLCDKRGNFFLILKMDYQDISLETKEKLIDKITEFKHQIVREYFKIENGTKDNN